MHVCFTLSFTGRRAVVDMQAIELTELGRAYANSCSRSCFQFSGFQCTRTEATATLVVCRFLGLTLRSRVGFVQCLRRRPHARALPVTTPSHTGGRLTGLLVERLSIGGIDH